MSLSIQPLFKSMVRQFHTVTTDERFQADFVDATNDVLDELSFLDETTSHIEHINTTHDSISEMNYSHAYIVKAGLVLNLILSGRKHLSGDNAFAIAQARWNETKGDYQVKNYIDDADEDEADLVGLGYVGD